MPSREASLRNLAKARANWRPPRPWRSIQETGIIRRLAWQWFTYEAPGKWSLRAVARWLGVTHTYVQKLVREFKRNPSEMQREARFKAPATIDELERARAETRRQRECGQLREFRKRKWAEFKVGDQVIRHAVLTKAEQRRQAAEARGRPLGPTYVPYFELPVWAKGLPSYVPQTPLVPSVTSNHVMGQGQRRQLRPMRFGRRWRPGMSWRP